jgi:hypothetical protein
MRKYQQKQLLELINTLGEVHVEIRRLLTARETQDVIGLLSDCQGSAAQIGEFIEQLEGEGTKTVSFLEEYCELLYQISVAISGQDNDDVFFGHLQGQLVKIENSIRNDLKPNRFEMVFLPYKASMWDSMESVWLAAKDDPQCDAYVVPIPYYDRLPDGTMGQMHDEGGQYPDYVPVVDWRKYNIEQRRPDIIVNHNPYDDWNYVTSVHPNFYSKRLKNLTDLLIYIPYFVCVSDVPKHFCVCNAVLYADKVIVQSEKIKETYLREFRKMEEENDCKGRFGDAETKFLTLGSPKFDKAINTRREDCQVPDAWMKLIGKSDGTRKKVILYNTSISELLEGNEKVLIKLRYVFDCFRGRDDVVLLWRPHPLNVAAYESMRPQLVDGYLDIVAEYKRQGWGIYDDTADLHRAIAISDAYYGDGSSLVAFYQCTGKLVMIQDAGVSKSDVGATALVFGNLYDDGDNFWFTAYYFNTLFKMDKQTWKAEYVGSFPNEEMYGWRLYGSITAYNEKLYFAPGFAHEIAEYNHECNTFRKISITDTMGKMVIQDFPGSKFNEAVLYKTCLFFVGFSYPAIIKMDMITGRLDFFSDWFEPLNKLISNHDGYYFKSVCVVGSCITAAALSANAVVIFDMDTCISKVYEVGSKTCLYSGICFDGTNYWLSPRYDGPIVKWNPKATYKEYQSFPDGFISGMLSFWNICCSDAYVWLFPNQANMALKINVQDERIVIAEEFQQECEFDLPGCSNYIFSKVIGDEIFAHTGKTNRLISYNNRTGHRREESVLLSRKAINAMKPMRLQFFIKDIAKCKTEYDCYYYENAFLALNDFLNYVVQHGESENAKALYEKQIEIFKEMNEQADGTSGTVIFQYCKQAMIC